MAEFSTGELGVYAERSVNELGKWAKECVEYIDKRYLPSIGKKVYELGLGSGSILEFLRDKFGEKVFGMDVRDTLARDKKIMAGLLNGEPISLPVASNSVDLLVSIHPFEESQELDIILKESERMLVSNGETTMIIRKNDSNEESVKSLLETVTKMELVGSTKTAETVDGKSAWIVSLRKGR